MLYGVAGVGARVPKYWGNYFGIYKYAFIEAVHMQIEIVNVGANAGTVALAEGNSIDSVSVDMNELARTPRSIVKTSYPGGNHSVISIGYVARTSQIMGRNVSNDQPFWTLENTGPTAPVLPLLVLGWQPVVALTTFAVAWTIKIRYDLSFFSINPQ